MSTYKRRRSNVRVESGILSTVYKYIEHGLSAASSEDTFDAAK